MKIIIDGNKLLEHIGELQGAGCSLNTDELIAISEPYGFRPLTEDCRPKEEQDFLLLYDGVMFNSLNEDGYITGYTSDGDKLSTSLETLIFDGVSKWMPIPGDE